MCTFNGIPYLMGCVPRGCIYARLRMGKNPQGERQHIYIIIGPVESSSHTFCYIVCIYNNIYVYHASSSSLSLATASSSTPLSPRIYLYILLLWTYTLILCALTVYRRRARWSVRRIALKFILLLLWLFPYAETEQTSKGNNDDDDCVLYYYIWYVWAKRAFRSEPAAEGAERERERFERGDDTTTPVRQRHTQRERERERKRVRRREWNTHHMVNIIIKALLLYIYIREGDGQVNGQIRFG